MTSTLSKKVTLAHLRAARESGTKVPMLTCYDYTSARLMHEAGVPTLLVGDSAASVMLGHSSTLPVPLSFMIELTAAVRRGAPLALLVGDMPFGSYGGALGPAVENVFQMVKQTGCDCVKLEVAAGHAELVQTLADAGVAVVAHLGLKPQSVNRVGGYKFQGRTAVEAEQIVDLARSMESAGASALLVEAVPPEVAEAVVRSTTIPVIGCGAGRACHAYVVVTHDAVGLTPQVPRFVPRVGDLATPFVQAFRDYVRQVNEGRYPAPEHDYEMPARERENFVAKQATPGRAT